jgi:glycosyltransferase involved in cell wall biosynthesis
MEDTNRFPLVSIGLTTFNRPNHLVKAVNQLKHQTYKNLEIIISDDNPSESKNLISIKRFLNDPRIRYYKSEENKGMNLNFLSVLQRSKGIFFMWAADDDFWELDYIENCVEILLKYPTCVLVLSKVKFIDNDYNSRGRSEEDLHLFGLNEKYRFIKYFKNSQIHNVGFYGLYRSDILKKLYFPNCLSNDRLLLLELSLKGHFYQFDANGLYYNITGSSKSMESYMKAMKINSNLVKRAPHFAFNLLHFKAIFWKWENIGILKRINYACIFFTLIKNNGYLKKSLRQLIKVLSN